MVRVLTEFLALDPPECKPARPGEREYEYYRRLLQAEVNAAIDGAQLAGATSFLVNDSHSSMQNLLPDQLHGRAAYLSGRHKPLYMMQGLDASFHGCFFVSYHGSKSAEPSALSHTYNPRAIAEVVLNGLHPDVACELIGDAAKRTLQRRHQPPVIDLPATLEVRFRHADLAQMATWLRGVERTGTSTVSMTDDDPLRLYRTFVTAVCLTRGVAE